MVTRSDLMLLKNPPRVRAHAWPHTFLQPLLLDPRSMVPVGLTGLVNTQPNLCDSFLIKADHDDSKVTLICGEGGVASEVDWFFAVLKVGQAITRAIASIACALDHCHVPGCSEYSVIFPQTVEIGLTCQ